MPYLGLEKRPWLNMCCSSAALIEAEFGEAAIWLSPACWNLGHLAIARMRAKVINVASWLGNNKLPLAAQKQMKSNCFPSD